MSTFNGITKEIPNISFDRFDGHNLKSKVFFLSHCHWDHMTGLSYEEFKGPLYVSKVSMVLVKYQFPHITDIRCLDIGAPNIIEYSLDNNHNKEKIVVTPIPAFHCPGSVMFIIETLNTRILYTGDFRMRLKDLKKICAFKSHNEVLHFDAIYIDSTFFDKDYPDFPHQFDSTNEICKLIKDWVSIGKQYIVSIKTPARYGSEFLFTEIAKQLKMKIHVNYSELKKYQHFSEMDNCVTEDSDVQIHACVENSVKNFKSLACKNLENNKFLRVIRPSALIWKHWKIGQEIIKKESKEIFRVCYSSHSSYNEVRDMIMYLKPHRVDLNVIPENEAKRLKMFQTLQETLLGLKTDAPNYPFDKNVFTFDKIAIVEKNTANNSRFEDEDEEEDIIIDVPVKKRKT